jgi:hypothetical protein
MATRKKGSKKYGAGAQKKVKKVMQERKAGTLRSGRSKKPVKSRKQAIAIGLSEARRAGAKVPKKPGSRKKSSAKKGSAKKSTARKSSTRKKGTARKSRRGRAASSA